jgi:hypothetical protein
VRSEWVKQGSFSYRSGLTAAEQILDSARRPTAIFASNDDMAAAAIAVAHRTAPRRAQGPDHCRFRRHAAGHDDLAGDDDGTSARGCDGA